MAKKHPSKSQPETGNELPIRKKLEAGLRKEKDEELRTLLQRWETAYVAKHPLHDDYMSDVLRAVVLAWLRQVKPGEIDPPT